MMKKIKRFLVSIAFISAAVSAVIYYLHKRGILHIEINYNGEDGQSVSRDLDEIVDTAAGSVSEKVSHKVTSVASDVRNKIEHQLGIVSEQLGGIIVPSTVSAEDFAE